MISTTWKGLIIALVVTVIALGGIWPAPAAAQVSCGATITADTTLTATDPVTTTPCPSYGITIGADNLTLDCAGLTIKGKGSGNGIRLGSGVSGATIQNCVVDGFQKGVLLGAGGGAFVTNLVSQNNDDIGIHATSDFNFFLSVLSRNNGGHGFQFSGIGNGAEGAIALGNGKAGFQIAGREADISSSLAISNALDGFAGSVRGSLFSNISVISNVGSGMTVGGGSLTLPNEYSGVKAVANGGNGILIPGSNPDANVDGGDNIGLANAGAIPCQIAGQPCQ